MIAAKYVSQIEEAIVTILRRINLLVAGIKSMPDSNYVCKCRYIKLAFDCRIA